MSAKSRWPSTGKPSKYRAASSVPMLVSHCQLYGLPTPELEVRFHPTRRWKADLLWRAPKRLIVEVQGAIWIQGHHSRGKGMEDDMEKTAHAVIAGYHVMHVSPGQIKSGQAVRWVERFFQHGQGY